MEPNAPKLILVPTDFSAPSAQALRYGAALADRLSAHLLVMYADPFVPPVDFTISAAGSFDLPREELIEGAREQLQSFTEANVPSDVPYDVRVVVGTPIDAILLQVAETGAELIVMGTHGRTGLRRLLLGSVTEAVMRLATVPLIVVHEESKERAAAMRRVVSAAESTKEMVAATRWARALADRDSELLQFGDGADVIALAKTRHADLIVLGIPGDHDERIIRHSTCAVLTVNRFAAARLTGVKVDEREPALIA